MNQARNTKMLQGQDIICFSNDWNSDPLSKKHIMTRLAQANRVLWVNSIGTRTPRASHKDFRRAAGKLLQFARGCQSPHENIVVFSPMAIPFHGNKVARLANRQWLSWSIRRVCKRLGFHDPITWSFLPSAAGIVGTLGEKLIIYHCVDEFSEFTGTDKTSLLAMEEELLEKADVVLVSSEPLYESKRQNNQNTFLVTHGVDCDHFGKACNPLTVVPQEIANLPKPIIGFFGLVADWVDLRLVRFLAIAKPTWTFVLVGKIDTETNELDGLMNVRLLGRRNYQDLPAYCKGFDIAILPFVKNALTIAANPLKLREYLAAGLPVVATDIPEAIRLQPLLRIGENFEHFLQQLEELLTEMTGPQPAISNLMKLESWDEKVTQLSQIVRTAQSARATGEHLSSELKESLCSNS